MGRIGIVSDSTCDLGPEWFAENDAVMVPLYLPPKLDQDDMSRGRPVFYGGINVALQQAFPALGKVPRWLDAPLSWRMVLGIASLLSGMTRAKGHGALAVSMLKGEEGRQAKEMERLVEWLDRRERPEVVLLSNAMLVGAAGMADELVNIVACHAKEGEGRPQVIETTVGDRSAACAGPMPPTARAPTATAVINVRMCSPLMPRQCGESRSHGRCPRSQCAP